MPSWVFIPNIKVTGMIWKT